MNLLTQTDKRRPAVAQFPPTTLYYVEGQSEYEAISDAVYSDDNLLFVRVDMSGALGGDVIDFTHVKGTAYVHVAYLTRQNVPETLEMVEVPDAARVEGVVDDWFINKVLDHVISEWEAIRR